MAAAERKPCARKRLQQYWGNDIEHIYGDNEDLIDSKGVCLLHNQACATRRVQVDLACAGLPCQGFSKKRFVKSDLNAAAHSAQSSKQGLPEQHPGHKVHKPLGFIIEEVENFMVENKAGTSYCNDFCSMCKRHGYWTVVVSGKHGDWAKAHRDRTSECKQKDIPKYKSKSTSVRITVNISYDIANFVAICMSIQLRQRIFVFGLSADLGGRRAAEWVAETIEENQNYRRMLPPLDVIPDIINPVDGQAAEAFLVVHDML